MTQGEGRIEARIESMELQILAMEARRKEARISQERVAAVAGISVRTYARLAKTGTCTRAVYLRCRDALNKITCDQQAQERLE